ncbi:MAG TPA: hypothetical protein V6D17_00185 [Candidatus Obscuribacterales bacterium]
MQRNPIRIPSHPYRLDEALRPGPLHIDHRRGYTAHRKTNTLRAHRSGYKGKNTFRPASALR